MTFKLHTFLPTMHLALFEISGFTGHTSRLSLIAIISHYFTMGNHHFQRKILAFSTSRIFYCCDFFISFYYAHRNISLLFESCEYNLCILLNSTILSLVLHKNMSHTQLSRVIWNLLCKYAQKNKLSINFIIKLNQSKNICMPLFIWFKNFSISVYSLSGIDLIGYSILQYIFDYRIHSTHAYFCYDQILWIWFFAFIHYTSIFFWKLFYLFCSCTIFFHFYGTKILFLDLHAIKIILHGTFQKNNNFYSIMKIITVFVNFFFIYMIFELLVN